MAYTAEDLRKAYEALGVSLGGVIFVVSELWRLRELSGADGGDPHAVPRTHYRVLRDLLGSEGTLCVLAASTNLCNTDRPFDPQATPSDGVGIFSEFVRTLPEARRSFHPFVSHAAIGPLADHITQDVARHSFGPETPQARLIELDALTVSIGMRSNLSCCTGHHVEYLMNVPFRYTKEFIHPVVRNSDLKSEPFYMHVWYRDIGMVKDRYVKLFDILTNEHGFRIKEAKVGRGTIFSYSMREFYRKAVKVLAKDIYVSCKERPHTYPFRS